MFPLNLPNALTLVRILLVPVLIVALTGEVSGGSAVAAAVFAVAALTDGLDGYIARSRQSVTTFGKVMDPVADKLMIAAALISLVSLHQVAPWVAMVIIAREFAVSGLRIAAGQQGVVIPASGLGKLKTIVQVAAVLALIAAPDYKDAWVQALVYAMVLITVVSGRGLLPQLQAQARGGLEREAPGGDGLAAGAGRVRVAQVVEQLGAAGAADVEHVLEEVAVDLEHGAQQVLGAHRVALALGGVAGRPRVTRSSTASPRGGWRGPRRSSLSDDSPTPSACMTRPTSPCSRSARSQRSASSSAEWAKGIAVPASATTSAASWERGM